MIGGEAGVGKSILALQLCFCFATGSPFIGLPVARPYKTLYVQTELDPDLVETRWGMQSREFPEVPGGYFAHYSATPWIWEEQVAPLIDVILKNGFEVLVLDPFSAIANLPDENDNAKANVFLRQELDAVKFYCDLQALVVVHHFKKPQAAAQYTVPPLALLRGAGAIGDWADAFLGLMGVRQYSDAMIVPDKLRAFPPKDSMMVTRSNETLVYADAGWQVFAVEKALMDGEWHTREELSKEIGISNERLNAIIRDMTRDGIVEPGSKGRVRRSL